MLDIKRVLAASPKEPSNEPLIPLTTTWGEGLLAGKESVWTHPHPQFERASAVDLNGWWDFSIGSDALDRKIRVPFSPEAALSGIGEKVEPGQTLWYRRRVEVGELADGCRALLRFEAVDWACEVWANDVLVGEHKGAYLPISCDITDVLDEAGTCELCVLVTDPSDTATQLRGKQSSTPGGIWYTAQSGIWRDVWLEVVPTEHLTGFRVDTSLDGHVELLVEATDNKAQVTASVLDNGVEVARGVGLAGQAIALGVNDPHLWSVEDPYLYDVVLTYGNDVVRSYFGFRSCQVAPDEQGVPRFFLNGKPYFVRGVLDQGYWPDGLMTPPCAEALEFDIRSMRDAGFNLLRKHIKVEDGRFYALCDRIGMLVLQDVPTGGGAYSAWHTSQKPTLFRASWTHMSDEGERAHKALASDDAAYRREWLETCDGMVDLLRNHPCVIGWCLFNEGWGQFDAAAAAARVRAADPTRPVDATSGWYDQRAGDFWSIHNYFRPLGAEKDPAGLGRAYFLSEFGGVTLHVEGHSSRPTAYGYYVAEGAAGFRREVAGLLAQADALEKDGLAGFVYTQLSDVEEETNGLLTYDRRVNKLVSSES